MSAIAYTLSLENSAFIGALRGAQAALSNFRNAVLGPVAALGGILAGFAGVAGAAGLMKRGIEKASEMEDLEVSFAVLLGGMDKAKARMADLAKFADTTPFRLPEVASASRTLETLTRGALSAGPGLRMVGDLAAGTGAGFEELAMHVGRLYDGLQSGRAVGESLQRLQELGVVSGAVRSKIEQLQEQGQKGDAVWSVAAASFGRFSGLVDARSRTMSGLLSTLSDSFDAVLREFARPVNDALKPLITQMNTALGKMQDQAKELGRQVGNAISVGIQLFNSGQLGTAAGIALEIGFRRATNFLGNTLAGIAAATGVALGEALNVVATALGNSSFWAGITKLMESAGLSMVSVIQEGLARVFAAVPGMGKTAVALQESAMLSGLMARGTMGQARESFSSADFRPVIEAAMAGGMETFQTFLRAYQRPATDDAQIKAREAELTAILKNAQGMVNAAKLLEKPLVADRKIPKDEESPIGRGGKLADGDRLARIGGFIGGMGGPALDYARRTAAAVEKVAAWIIRPSGSPAGNQAVFQ